MGNKFRSKIEFYFIKYTEKQRERERSALLIQQIAVWGAERQQGMRQTRSGEFRFELALSLPSQGRCEVSQPEERW